MARIQVRNLHRQAEPVGNCLVFVVYPHVGPPSIAGRTNTQGIVSLDFSSLAQGQHTLQVAPEHTTADEVGPATGDAPGRPSRVYRSLSIQIRVGPGGSLQTAHVAAGAANGTITVQTNPALTINLRPAFMQSPNTRRRGGDPTLVIVHHTGGDRIGPAINEFMSTASQKAIHYMIDTDGQILKMALDTQVAGHAGVSHWAGVNDVNSISIGIEIVNRAGAYPQAQMDSLLGLLGRLRAAHSSIPARQIVGHSDVGTNANRVLGRKSGCPGSQFQWQQLEARGLGLIPNAGPWPPEIYGGFFVAVANGSLRSGDNDGARQWGGAVRPAAAQPAVSGTPVQELQTDLAAIGYSVGRADGDFGQKTARAVQMLQEHFFAGSRGGGGTANGRVDIVTAHLIKSLR